MKLAVLLKCDVEDVDEASAKTRAIKAVLEVYPFLTITSQVVEDIDFIKESEEPQ